VVPSFRLNDPSIRMAVSASLAQAAAAAGGSLPTSSLILTSLRRRVSDACDGIYREDGVHMRTAAAAGHGPRREGAG